METIDRGETGPTIASIHPDSAGEEVVLVEWTVHLLRREPGRARVVFAAMAFAMLLGWGLFRSLLFSLVGAVMIFSATAEYLLPIRYRLTTHRACASYGAARLEIEWERVRRVDVGRMSVKLSPFLQANRLDAFRGVLLRFASEDEAANRAAVLRIVEERATLLHQESA